MPEQYKISHDLSRGAPPPNTVASGLFKEIDWKALIEENPDVLLYKGSDEGGQNFIGYGPLRKTLAKKHGVDDRRIITAHGGMASMSLFLNHLLLQRYRQRKAGESPDRPITVATEVPTYDRFPKNLESHNMDWKGVAFREDGELDIDALTQMVETGKIDAFYAIPEGQNPTGRVYSPEMRQKVEEVTAQNGVMVLWDGAYWNLTYQGRENKEITDPPENVVWSFNYTKEISAGLKNGYLIVPDSQAKNYDSVVSNSRLNSVYPIQAWLNKAINSQGYPLHLEHLQKIFGPRFQEFMRLVDEMHPGVKLSSRPDSGYFVEEHFPQVQNHDAFLHAMRSAGIEPGDSRASYHPDFLEMANGVIRVPVATLQEQKMPEILTKLLTGYEQYLKAA